MKDTIRIANCSGFYGDRLGAALDMVTGGPIDVLTGDYLAELTMSILHRQRATREESTGYVRTFLKQLEDVAAICLERNIRIVVNAGGLNPAGMARAVEALLEQQGLRAKVAYIEGDDLSDRIDALGESGEPLSNLDTGQSLQATDQQILTANAYLGGWGIKEALDQGADIVICPRVTDAALTIGPAAWKFNWTRDNYDALAGALTAGHIIECGAQCCGGNYAFFKEVKSYLNVGYPIAEIEADGSFTISKHPGTGGLISTGTITAQLLYEVGSSEYLNPDVTLHLDSIHLEQVGEDLVRVSGCRGSSPPQTHKVCINTLGPSQQTMEIPITGLDIEDKATTYLDTILHNLGGRQQFDNVDVQLLRTDKENPATNEQAQAVLRVIFTSQDPSRLGRLLEAKVNELVLANIPGIAPITFSGGFPAPIHWPALVSSEHITEKVVLNGRQTDILPTQRLGLAHIGHQEAHVQTTAPPPPGKLIQVPLGRIYGTRSGDKGGNANCGIWAKTDEDYSYLCSYLTVEKFKALSADIADYRVERFELPNLRALNFVIHGMLGTGAASNHRRDRQAKSLGEYIGAKLIDIPGP